MPSRTVIVLPSLMTRVLYPVPSCGKKKTDSNKPSLDLYTCAMASICQLPFQLNEYIFKYFRKQSIISGMATGIFIDNALSCLRNTLEDRLFKDVVPEGTKRNTVVKFLGWNGILSIKLSSFLSAYTCEWDFHLCLEDFSWKYYRWKKAFSGSCFQID